MLEEVVSVQWNGEVESPAKIKSTRRPAWRKQFLSGEQRFMHGGTAEVVHFIASWSDPLQQWILKRRHD